ncbi:Uncharacterised protein [uncultured archaeon]|nr:Uncharacterised protein [uncultured archaeon]
MRSEKKPYASPIDIEVTSIMDFSAIVIASASSFSLLPWQRGQTSSLIYLSKSSRLLEDSVSIYIRHKLGSTPSKVPFEVHIDSPVLLSNL